MKHDVPGYSTSSPFSKKYSSFSNINVCEIKSDGLFIPVCITEGSRNKRVEVERFPFRFKNTVFLIGYCEENNTLYVTKIE
jgi:hypothetical protein